MGPTEPGLQRCAKACIYDDTKARSRADPEQESCDGARAGNHDGARTVGCARCPSRSEEGLCGVQSQTYLSRAIDDLTVDSLQAPPI